MVKTMGESRLTFPFLPKPAPRPWRALLPALVVLLLLLSVSGTLGSQEGACGLPAVIQGIMVEEVCNKLGVRYRSIYGPDRSPWIAIDNAGDCDRVRAEINRILSSPSQETVPPEPPPMDGTPAGDPNYADAVQNLARGIAELLTRRDFAAAARLYKEAIPGVRRNYGPDHWMVASYLASAARLYVKAGMEAEAEECWKQVVAAAEGSGDPESISIHRRNLADFYEHRDAARMRREEEERKKEAKKRAQSIEQLRSELKPIETDGQGAEFGLKAEFKPLGQDYPAPGTAWEQALCAAYLSDMARQAGSAEDARFYAEQAASVMAGGRIHVRWNPPEVSPAQARRLEEMGRRIAENAGEIRTLAPRIIQAGEQAWTAEIRKNDVTQKRDASRLKVEMARQAAHEAPPERKQVADHLLALAEHELIVAENQLVQADQELNMAKLEERSLDAQQKELEAEIRKLEEQMRAEAGGANP
jgi:hypothetical protein